MLKPNHKFYLNNFAIYRKDRAEHGGGVALCINKNIKHKLINTYNTNTIENISVAVNINNREIIMTSAYSPKYVHTFQNDIKKITPIRKEFIVFGDLNARNVAWNCVANNMAGNKFVNIQHQRNFFIHHSNLPTHFPHSGATPSTIDLMLSNSTLNLSPLYSHVHELASDHAPVVATIDADIETKNSSQIYHYKNADWMGYQLFVNGKINLETEITSSNDVDQGLEHLINTIHKAKGNRSHL